MDDHQALAIVTALAHGAHPQTGEVFERESVYQSPDVIRALFVAQRAIEAKITERPTGLPISPPPRSNVVQTKYSAADSLNKTSPVNKTNQAQAVSHVGSNVGKPWTVEEDERLLRAFDNDQPITEIARIHSRSPAGIRSRLEKHGRLESIGHHWSKDKSSRKGSG